MKLWINLSIWSTFIILLVFGIIMGVLVTSWKESVEAAWDHSSAEMLSSVQRVIEEHLDTVVFASRFVPLNTDAKILLDYYLQYEKHSGYKFNSIGFLTTGKHSWQIADYKPACPLHYGYFFSNVTIHPRFIGYCSTADDQINYDQIAYEGFDWGLKPEEKEILNGTIAETFLPIFDLLGAFTLTYEVGRGTYVSFAEIGLKSLSEFVAQIKTDANIFIVDNKLQQTIVGTSVNWSYKKTFTTTCPGLSWTVFVEQESIYGDIYYRIMIACIICAVVTLLMIVMSYFVTYFCVTKQLEKKRKGQEYMGFVVDDLDQ